MKFIVNSQFLDKKLQPLSTIAGQNKSIPALGNFLFVLEGKQLRVTASDLETTIVADFEINEAIEDGSVAVPAKILMDTLKTFSNVPLIFSVNDGNAIKIKTDDGDFNMVGESPEGFPLINFEGTSQAHINAGVLNEAIAKTLFATGEDSLRPIMSGVLFEFNPDNITFVATDAHKLVRYTREDEHSGIEASFVIHKKVLNALKNTLQSNITDDTDTVNIEFDDRNALFTFNGIRAFCRLNEGKFPNYKAVIPEDNPNKLTADRLLFLNAVRRASIYSEKSSPQVRLKINGQELIVKAEDPELANKSSERISCTYVGEPIEIGFNAKFLMEMLNNIDSNDIVLEMSNPSRAGILTPPEDADSTSGNILMLVMPVMLGN
ncbi:DNA polymerase III subunit beta [Bacteroidia bacterium]|nr:DNA polymerase III subunit beta [Bacteroidia bacterium]